jgi:hypothetical protein
MKRTCWIGFVLFSLAVGFFHQPLFFFLTKWVFQFSSQRYFGEPVAYEKAYWENNRLVLLSPRLEKNNRLVADRLLIAWHFSLPKRQLEIDLQLEKPCWKLDQQKLKWSRFSHFFVQEEPVWFTIKPSLRVKEGYLSWKDQKSEHSIYFDFIADSSSGGTICAYLEKEERERNRFTFQIEGGNGKDIAVNWNFQHLSCSSFLSFLQLFSSHFKPFEISSGNVHGQFTAIFPKGERPFGTGQLCFKELTSLHASSGITLYLQEAIVNLKKNKTDYQGQRWTTLGQLELLQPASLSCLQKGQRLWHVQDLKGTIHLQEPKILIADLLGTAFYGEQQSHLRLNGSLNLDATQPIKLSCQLLYDSLRDSKGEIQCSLYSLEKGCHTIEVHAKSLAHSEFAFLQTLLSVHYPSLNQIELKKGTLHLSIKADLVKNGVENLRFYNLQSSNIALRIIPWQVVFHAHRVQGRGDVDFTCATPWQGLSADLQVQDGLLESEKGNLSWKLTNVQTQLLIRQGMIDHSLIHFYLGSLKGVADIEWKPGKEQIELALVGHAQALAPFLPTRFQKSLAKFFNQDGIEILATLQHKEKMPDLRGVLRFSTSDCIYFGCEYKEGLAKNMEGWFYSQGLFLEKYLSPFLFPDEKVSLKGRGDFKGAFNLHQLDLHYRCKEMTLESEDLLIEVKEFKQENQRQFFGSHYFNLDTFEHQGSLPVKNATYYEKNKGIVFSDICTDVLFHNQTIRFNALEAFSNEIYFSGSMQLDYSDPAPGVFSLQVSIPALYGKVFQVQNFLAHFNDNLLLHQIPLEGDIECRQDGLQLVFNFKPKEYQLQAHGKGTILNGSFSFPSLNVNVEGLSLDFDYDHENNSLHLKDFQGSLLIGKGSKAEEYALKGNGIQFSNVKSLIAEIDLWVENGSEELMHIAGATQTLDNHLLAFIMDRQRFHIGGVYPAAFDFQIKDGNQIELFQLAAEFSFDSFWQHLQSLSRAQVFSLPQALKNKIQAFETAQGKINFQLQYSGLQDELSYRVQGENIAIGDSHFKTCFLQGKKQDKRWLIDQLQLDQLSLSAEMQREDEFWNVYFLGLRYGKSLLLGLQGKFLDQNSTLEADVHLLDFNLAYLEEWEPLQPYLQNYLIQGDVKGEGKMTFSFISEAPWIAMEGSLQAFPRNLKVNNCCFLAKHPLSLKFKTGHYVSIEEGDCYLTDSGEELFHLNFHRLHYEADEEKLKLNRLYFHIPFSHLSKTAALFHQRFPQFVDAKLAKILTHLKKQEDLKGFLSLEKEASSYHFHLQLEDGRYHLKQRDYDLKDIALDIDNHHLQLRAYSHYERCPFHLYLMGNWPFLDRGELVFTESAQRKKDSLRIQWIDTPPQGLMLQSIHGSFSGLSCHLKEIRQGVLEGEVQLEIESFSNLLPVHMLQNLAKLQLGPRYVFRGYYEFNLEQDPYLMNCLFFNGQLQGTETILKGYQVERLQALVQYAPGRVDLQDLKMQDEAGSLSASHLVFLRDPGNEEWQLFIPKLVIKDFRPSLLREPSVSLPVSSSKFANLLIRRFEIEDFYGYADQVSSWKGKGRLHFLNPSRKSIQHPLLAIPAEIILRLGLNPQVLNPVTGTIYFYLDGDHFYLTKFKDVYSEGRASKFYLANTIAHPSWLDFQGNLFVQVRMKQYNLLFKISELFTVSIQGNIKKPKYALQKQVKSSLLSHERAE